MKQDEITSLRYRHASLAVNEHTSRGQRLDSETILELIKQIDFYQDEIDRLQQKLADVAVHDSEAGKT